MPASSRKRNKGKDRKAKKAMEKEEAERVKMQQTWQKWARGFMSGAAFIQCNHGFGELALTDKSPVSSFITIFCMTSLEDSIRKYPEVKNDASLRQMTTDIFIRIGANMLCECDAKGDHTKENMPLKFIINVALAILSLEYYDGTLDYISNAINPSLLKKYRNIQCGSSARRDLLKFFRKRLKCKCLKKLHLEARKTQPKLGTCAHCNQVKERDLLMACSRCRICEYCSKECQVAASPIHREICDKFFGTHEEQQQAK